MTVMTVALLAAWAWPRATKCVVDVAPELVRRLASESVPVTEAFEQVSLSCEGLGSAQVVLLTLAIDGGPIQFPKSPGLPRHTITLATCCDR